MRHVVLVAVVVTLTFAVGAVAAVLRAPGAQRLSDASILFRDDRGVGFPSTFVMDADGRNRRSTAQLPDRASICGDKVVHGVTRVNIAGPTTPSQTLFAGPGENGSPTCAPGGSQIAFISNRDGNYEIYVMNADGGGQRRVTSTPTRFESQVTWSPDGTTLAFTSIAEGSADSDIFVVNVDGSGIRNLTDAPGSEEHPTWSPDGNQIAFQSTRGSDHLGLSRHSDIYVMSSNGTDQRLIASHPENDRHPEWSPDGMAIAFQSTRGNSIYVVRPDGTGAKRIGQGFAPLWVPADHPWVERR